LVSEPAISIPGRLLFFFISSGCRRGSSIGSTTSKQYVKSKRSSINCRCSKRGDLQSRRDDGRDLQTPIPTPNFGEIVPKERKNGTERTLVLLLSFASCETTFTMLLHRSPNDDLTMGWSPTETYTLELDSASDGQSFDSFA